MSEEKVKNNKELSKSSQDEKKISNLISNKILTYKESLDAVPLKIISIEQSEQDRKEVNGVYSAIESTNNQLLDSKFYTQVLKMNRERDKNYLKEGTTRKERITILAQLISRVTTPIIFLNHKRNILLSNFYVLDDQKKKTKDIDNGEIYYQDPITTFKLPNELTGKDILELRKQVLDKVQNKTWNLESVPNFNLTDWEADILSQLTRDEEISIQIDKNAKKAQIVKNDQKNKNKNIISYLIEPEKDFS